MNCVALGLAGWIFGYKIGAHIGCGLISPGTNLCGLPGMLFTGPAGLIVGCLAAWRLDAAQQTGQSALRKLKSAIIAYAGIGLFFTISALVDLIRGTLDMVTLVLAVVYLLIGMLMIMRLRRISREVKA